MWVGGAGLGRLQSSRLGAGACRRSGAGAAKFKPRLEEDGAQWRMLSGEGRHARAFCEGLEGTGSGVFMPREVRPFDILKKLLHGGRWAGGRNWHKFIICSHGDKRVPC